MNDVLLEQMGVDLRTEIRVAQFWRQLITDEAYLRFDPMDMLRWYMALELRGAQDVRDYLTERPPGPGVANLTGIVGKAPHPPIWLVEAWLSHHEEKLDVSWVWKAAVASIVASFMVGSWITGWPYLGNRRPPYPGANPATTAVLPLPAPSIGRADFAPPVAQPSVISSGGARRSSGGAGAGGIAATGLGGNGRVPTPTGQATPSNHLAAPSH